MDEAQTIEGPASVRQVGFVSAFSKLDGTFWLVAAIAVVERFGYFGIKSLSGLYATQSAATGGVGLSAAGLGVALTIWAFLQSITSVCGGRMADTFGYRRTILAATTLRIAGCLIVALERSPFGFVAGVVLLAWRGVVEIRRGNVRAHRRRMLGAASLVALFVASYLVKVALLGKEDRSLWSDAALNILYVHETCIAVMLLAGVWAGYRAFRFRRSVGATLDADRPRTTPRDRVWHRRAGRVAVGASVLGWITSVGVLLGMYARAG